jgi:signal transduction histidine kinase
MSFRTRAFLILLLAALVPLGVLAFGIRREMAALVRREHEERAGAATGAIRTELARENAEIEARLRRIASELAGDTRFRLAVEGRDVSARAWLLDYASAAMRTAGLDLLQVQDAGGTILTSGHFRNEYDRAGIPAAAALAQAGGMLLRVRTPDGNLLALAGVHPFRAGGDEFTVLGGVALDSARLARMSREPDLEARLATDGSAPGEPIAAAVTLRLVDATGARPVSDSAQLRLVRRSDRLGELQRRLDRWFLLVMAGTTALALLLAGWMAARISAPIRDLSEKTEALDLERLDQDFASERSDEIGTLSNLLDAMTRRLRASSARLRDAERRATVGDLSRQVNHDIRNGLAPIRHVVRHLSEVAEREPGKLAQIFAERRGTLESSVTYLESLAANYARLAPGAGRGATDAGVLVAEIARSLTSERVAVEAAAAPDTPRAAADAVTLRRVVENLVTNAIESIDHGTGKVSISAGRAPDGKLRITVADTGRGMTRAELERAFEDFHTTKPAGTGLGLSVVRRLVTDLGGSVQVATEPGAGSRFTVELPAHDTASGA